MNILLKYPKDFTFKKIPFLFGCFGICVVASFISFALCKSVIKKNIPKGYKPTLIREVYIKGNIIDVGEVSRDQLVISSFELLNIGKKPITIKKVKSSCGCIKADLLKRVVIPGENLIVPLTLDISKISSTSFQKKLLVEFENMKGEHNTGIVFIMQGLIDHSGKVLAWPNILDFGDVIAGQKRSKKVSFRASTKLTTNLPEVILMDELKEKIVNVQISHEKNKSSMKTIDIALKIPDSAKFGELNSKLTVKFQTSPPREVVFQIRAHIFSGVTVEPQKIYLSVSNKKNNNTTDVIIESLNTEHPIEINEISSELPIKWEVINFDTNGKWILRIQPLDNLNLSDVECGVLVIHFNNKSQQEIKVFLVPLCLPSDNSMMESEQKIEQKGRKEV